MATDRRELARLVVERWDEPGLLHTWAHPEIEFEMTGPGGGKVRGVEAMQRFFADFLKAWDRFHTVIEDFVELDDARLLALTRFAGHGKESGVPIEGMRGAALFGFRDDKVAELTLYPIRAEALAAVGLDPDEPRAEGGAPAD